MINNSNIEYENGYLHGKYAKSYWNKKKEIKALSDESRVKSSLFISLGSVIALSQIAEYVLFNICSVSKMLDSNPSQDKMNEIFDSIITSFNIDEIEIEKPPKLATVLNNLKQSGLISEETHREISFIRINRNNFAHNYFMRYPKALKELNEMKIFILQSFYTVLSLNQLINEVFQTFKEEVLIKHSSMLDFLNDFNKLFIGEFKG